MTDAETISTEASERRWRLLRVGALTAVAICIFLFLGYLISGGGSELFEPKAALRTYMADTTGLAKDSSVRLSGIPIGKIKELRLTGSTDPPRAIEIEMEIKSHYLSAIPQDSTIGIDAANVLGDKYVNIEEGKSRTPVKPGAELKSSPSALAMLNQADLLATMQVNLRRVDAMLMEIESGNTRIGKFFKGEEFYNRVRAQITAMQGAIQTLDSPKSELGKSLFTNEMYEQLRAPITDIDRMLAEIQRGEGTAGHLLNDTSLYEEARKTVSDLQRSLDDLKPGNGPMGKLMQTDETYVRLKKLADTIEQAVDSVNAGEGELGHLLNSPQLYESLSGSTRDLRAFLADFRANPQKFMRIKVF